MLAVCLGVFLFARHSHSVEAARALTFTSLVVAFLFIILTNRSWNSSLLRMLRIRNTAVWWVLSGAVAFLSLVLLIPVARGLFHFAPLDPPDLILSVGAGIAWAVVFEVLKFIRRRRAARSPA